MDSIVPKGKGGKRVPQSAKRPSSAAPKRGVSAKKSPVSKTKIVGKPAGYEAVNVKDEKIIS